MDKLEQVSENPELKEEMEREVTSTNSQVLTQAASWASWAVGAIGAKFYKSANKPPESATKEGESGGKVPSQNVENQSKQDSVKSQPKQPSQQQPSNQDLISLGNLEIVTIFEEVIILKLKQFKANSFVQFCRILVEFLDLIVKVFKS